ncbi:MAG: DUF881 domain-containing protein [Mycobacteriaceae bacterium]
MALLCAALGVGIVTQVRRTGAGDALDSARPADLVVLLDNLQQREASLRKEVTALQGTVAELTSDGKGSSAALAEARDRAQSLAVLVGTAAARGPGLSLQISDPDGGVGPDVVLDTVQELRAAGAEAVQIGGAGANPVRIGLDSAFTGSPGAVRVDGQQLRAPLVVTVIGDPATLAAALNIPGGVVDAVARAGGAVALTRRGDVEVTALRVPREPQYARPSS